MHRRHYRFHNRILRRLFKKFLFLLALDYNVHAHCQCKNLGVLEAAENSFSYSIEFPTKTLDQEYHCYELYASIDPIINDWIKQNQLHLCTQHQDYEVRSARLSDAQGRIYAIGIEMPDEQQNIKIRATAWNFKKRNKQYLTNPQELAETLEEALAQIKQWMQNK